MRNHTLQSWDIHYTKQKSVLFYPDEQLVRMLSSYTGSKERAIDIGCGTGRHIHLLHNFGFMTIIGLDTSITALAHCKQYANASLTQGDVKNLPFRDNYFDIAIAWGSLHYSYKDDLPLMLSEIKRILKPQGILYGTLRSVRDTYITRGTYLGNNTWKTSLTDISGAVISLYSLEEVQSVLRIFSEYKIGLMERTLLGKLDSTISHWFFMAIV